MAFCAVQNTKSKLTFRKIENIWLCHFVFFVAGKRNPLKSIYLLVNIYIRFGTTLYRQIVGIPMGTNCAPLVADLFLFCYEKDFMTSRFDVKQAEIIEAYKSTYIYLDDLLNIDILTLKAWSIVIIHLNCS